MHAPTSSINWAALAASERAQREQAENALASAQARIADLERRLGDTADSARRGQTQFTALVQNLRVGLLLVDHEGQIQFVNQHFWELFGLSPVPGPAEGGPPIPHAAVFIDPAFRDPAAFKARAIALHVAGQTVLQEEFVLADGRVVELDYLVLDTVRAGRLICYRDVTERHQRDAQIRSISFVPKQNPNPILRLTGTGEVVYSNPAAAQLLDVLRDDDVLSARLLSLVHKALSSPERQQQELTMAGEHYMLTAAAVPGEAYATVYLTNITVRRHIEQQMAEQRAFYESVLDQVPTAVAVFDAEHRYLFVNPAVEPDPAVRAWVVGKTNEEACAFRQRPLAIAQQRRLAFDQAVQGRREIVWEESRLNSENQPVHMLMHFRPVLNPNGSVKLMICSGSDITQRKLAEEKVVRQQEFYESILNLLPVDIAVFDAEHRFLFANPSSISDPEVRQQIIGLTNTEYVELRKNHQPPGVAEQRNQYFDLAVRTRADVTWEERGTDRLGHPQLMMRHLRPVSNADGSLRLVVGSGIDITARYTAERLQQQVQVMLQVQQAFIRQIIDALPNVLYMVDPDNSISFSNHAYEAIIAQSQHWQVEASAGVMQEMQEIRELNHLVRITGQAQTKELPFTLATGETLYFQVHKRPLLRADGQIGILTISTDVTAVKQARQELERREKQYHDLVYYSQALICTHDMEGKVLSVNPAIEQLLGIPATKLVGRALRDAMPRHHHAFLQAYLNGEVPSQNQPRMVTVLTSTGEERYLQYYTYQVAEEGYPPYVVASGYDVTDGFKAQRALQQAKLEAEENALAKEAFLARMSHEIRTPLNGVLGMAALLQKTSLTAPQSEYLNTMQHAGKHLLALVNDVLDMAKITTQHLQLSHEAFDLAVALQGAGHTVAALAAERGLELIVEPLPAGVSRVVGDAYRLHQVLLNLLSNAIKFTEKGSVRLGADIIRNTEHELVVRFWVQDTGIGIAPEQQAHIFDAFAQANAETSLRFGGTGLGLAISGQLVDQMGGTLRMCSVADEGTTFAFQLALPHAPENSALEQPAPADASYEGLRGLRVLLAEDNLVNQRIAVIVLEHWEVEVHAVSNGLDALVQLQEHPFDAALLDIRMPGLSGVEVTAAIRRHPDAAHANIPIIALTANAFEDDRAAYLAAGMNACLTKPYEEAALCQLLLELTGRTKM